MSTPHTDREAEIQALIEELRDVPGCEGMDEAQLRREAEREYAAGEEAIRDHLGRVTTTGPLSIERRLDGFLLQRGGTWICLSGHELDKLIDRVKAERAKDARAQRVTGKRLEGRLRAGLPRPSFRVVAGRLATSEQAA